MAQGPNPPLASPDHIDIQIATPDVAPPGYTRLAGNGSGGALQVSVSGSAYAAAGGGGTTLPSTLTLTDTATNTAPDGIIQKHVLSSGTAAAGIGITDATELPNDAGANKRAVSEVDSLTTVTAGSEVGKRAISTINSGALNEVISFFWQNPTLAAIMLGAFGHIIRASSAVLQLLNAGSNGLSLASGVINTVSANLSLDQRLYLNKGADVASATTVTLGNGNYFVVTGTTTITNIAVAGWTAGSRIVLVLPSGITITHTAAATSATIFLRLAANLTTVAVYTLELVYDGTQWRQPN